MGEYRLVIAEKPSVALSIAKALGASDRKEGYAQGNGWIVSWCLGHLAGPAEAGKYDPKYVKWNKADLPILPAPWRTVVLPDKREQFETLKSLMDRPDVAGVVNACDAGREGELIFRAVYELCGCKKPIFRLWISSMEESAIREGFARLRPGRDYEGLYQAALCRQRADWLVGINATRLFTLLYGHTLNVGRVMSPTLALLAERASETAAFTPTPFYVPELSVLGCTFSAERTQSIEAARGLVKGLGRTAAVKAVERKERREKAPALFDLTTLQRAANRALGYTAQQTLDYLQALYEKKLCTYPRTDSRFLTEDMESSVPGLAEAAAMICGMSAPETVLSGQVCDSSKVSDHHALLPTAGAAKADLSSLPVGEGEILKLVSLSLLRAVSPAYEFAETAVTLDCGGTLFTARGKEEISPGWKRYAARKGKPSEAIPSGFREGAEVPVDGLSIREGKTSPPKPYTEDTLLGAMETAGAKDMPEDAERRGIGTPATRAGILEKLVDGGFVQRVKKKTSTILVPTQLGVSLITVLPEELQSPLLTAEWEQRLKEVERGELDPREFMEGIAGMVSLLVDTYRPVPGTEALFLGPEEVVGKCPRCGQPVIEKKPGFFCMSCKFSLWKENYFFTNKKKVLDRETAAALLKDGRAYLKGCWSEKKGKTYNATVAMEDDGEKTSFSLIFDRRKGVKR